MSKTNIKPIAILIALLGTLISLFFVSLSAGENNIPFNDVINSLFGQPVDDYTYNVVMELRLPRTVTAIFVGATLSISGLLTSIALKNPLADSGILGIQSGATVGALIAMLVVPAFVAFQPLFAFLGGMIAFGALVLATSMKNGFKPGKVVLVGVGINAIATSLIGIISITNAQNMQSVYSWLNGSLVSISSDEMKIIAVYSSIMLLVAILLLPILKILLLDDNAIINVGHNPKVLRLIIAFLAVFLASISVAFVGIISFVGIIAPNLARTLVGHDLKFQMLGSMLIGSIIVLGADVMQKLIFAPMEVPVGIVIGLVGAPIFIILAGRK